MIKKNVHDVLSDFLKRHGFNGVNKTTISFPRWPRRGMIPRPRIVSILLVTAIACGAFVYAYQGNVPRETAESFPCFS